MAVSVAGEDVPLCQFTVEAAVDTLETDASIDQQVNNSSQWVWGLHSVGPTILSKSGLQNQVLQ